MAKKSNGAASKDVTGKSSTKDQQPSKVVKAASLLPKRNLRDRNAASKEPAKASVLTDEEYGEFATVKLKFQGHLLLNHMLIPRRISAEQADEWVEDGGVILILRNFKETDIDDATMYIRLDAVVGAKRSSKEIKVFLNAVTAASMKGVKQANEDESEEEKVIKRFAEVVKELAGIREVPGGFKVASNKEWNHKAAALLLMSVIMDLHRFPNGYFRQLLGGPPVPKSKISTAETAMRDGLAVDSGTMSNSGEEKESAEPGKAGKKRKNRRARDGGEAYQKKRAKFAATDTTEIQPEVPPPVFSRNRTIDGSEGYQKNRIGDGPRGLARSTAKQHHPEKDAGDATDEPGLARDAKSDSIFTPGMGKPISKA